MFVIGGTAGAIIGGSIVGGGMGLAGAAMNSAAAGSAADKQSAAARYAADLQHQQYEQQRDDQQPWRQAGQQALSQMGNPDFQKTFSMQDFQQDPGYQFRLQQGQEALERSAAARGGLMNGGFAKALSDYGQNSASNEYQNAYNRFTNDQSNRFNRLASLAGIGQTANGQLGQAGMNYANQAGEASIGGANAQAAGMLGGANAWSGALSSMGSGLSNNMMGYQMMNRMFPQSGSPTPQASIPESGGYASGPNLGINYEL